MHATDPHACTGDILGLPNLATGYAPCRAFLVDVLHVRTKLSGPELSKAVDFLSDAVMDQAVPLQAEQAYALAPYATVEPPSERLHELCTSAYASMEELAKAADRATDDPGINPDAGARPEVARARRQHQEWMSMLDAEFFEMRRIMIPLDPGGGDDDLGAARGGCRFSTSEDVYWFSNSAEDGELASACGLHALAPHYPASLRRLFVGRLHVPALPSPSTARLIEAMQSMADAPPSESLRRLVKLCHERLSSRSLTNELTGLDMDVRVVDASIGCPTHGPGCRHPACIALAELVQSGSAGRMAHGTSSAGGAGNGVGLYELGGGASDAREAMARAAATIERALNCGRRCADTVFRGRALGGGTTFAEGAHDRFGGGPGGASSSIGPGPCAECDENPCSRPAAFDLHLAFHTAAGLPVYVDRSLGSQSDLQSARQCAETFGTLLSYLSALLGPHVPPTVCIRWSPI